MLRLSSNGRHTPPASPGGPAQVGIPHSRAVKVFLRRCTLDQTQVNGGGFSNVDCFLRDGLTCPPAFATYVGQQNSMIALCTTIATIMCCTDRGFTWENPPDLRGPPHLPWAWPDMGRSVSSVWQTSWLVSLRRSFDLVQLHSAMCMFGSEYRKFFVLLMPRAYHSAFAVLDGKYCPGVGVHARHTPAHGVDEHAQSHATLAGRYPWRFNVFLIRRHARCAPSITFPRASRLSLTVASGPWSADASNEFR
mmetsp:Transcript_43578/g.108419  ORF Transcript_43578/g.108419 Transcript_43578/m.108419 type:complete len:250 (+) Transcript_43578:135-884(+)